MIKAITLSQTKLGDAGDVQDVFLCSLYVWVGICGVSWICIVEYCDWAYRSVSVGKPEYHIPPADHYRWTTTCSEDIRLILTYLCGHRTVYFKEYCVLGQHRRILVSYPG